MMEWILAAMLSLAPGIDHTELATAISRAVESEFSEEEQQKQAAALLVSVAYRESLFTLNAVGDHGTSFCAFQIHRSSGGTKALLEDANACTEKALEMLRISKRVCPAHPVAWYAEGPRGCSSPRAQRISADRMWVARRLMSTVTVPFVEGD